MFLNLSTTRTDGGWMYFKINNDYYIQLPGSGNKVDIYKGTTINYNLDVVSGTSSRIRSHASNNGYTGYSELNTASAWDMWINLSTTYPNGGWVYFQISNDNYMQLSGSDNKVNIYTDTTGGHLNAGQSQAQTSIKHVC